MKAIMELLIFCWDIEWLFMVLGIHDACLKQLFLHA